MDVKDIQKHDTSKLTMSFGLAILNLGKFTSTEGT